MQTEAFPSYVRRPKLDDVLDKAVEKLGEEVLDWLAQSDCPTDELDDDVKDVLADAIRSGDDGYNTAKELESRCGFDPDTSLVTILDDASSIGRQMVDAATRQWLATTDVRPKLTVGTTVTITKAFKRDETSGVIDEIDMKSGQYYVKLHPSDTSRRIFDWDVLEALNPTLLIDAESRS